MANKKWTGLLIGLLTGIIIGILPLFSGPCGFNETCRLLFQWPWLLFYPIGSLLGITGEGGMFVVFVAPIFYPVVGMIIGFFIGKQIKTASV